MKEHILQQLLTGAAFIIVLLPLSWFLAYVLFWLLIQRVPVDFRPFWSWSGMVMRGEAGEAPSTVALLAEVIFVFLLVVGGAVRYQQGRKRRGAGADEGKT